ncbi:hypothetical protein K492DRAFT_236816 [Lichtheimia hyalospora FSU 10163]|nr:hypothetical protein K492DRAFT_236816 [Lichtheimia hyalospora FSU 10163]
MLSMDSTMENDDAARPTLEAKNKRRLLIMDSNQVLFEWLKQPGNYGRYVRADGSQAPKDNERLETRTSMAREVQALLSAAGFTRRSHVSINQKMMNWVRRYKKAHQLACSGVDERVVRKTFPYYYQLVDCIGSDSDLPINTKDSIQKQRRQALASSNTDTNVDSLLEGSPLSSAASLSPSHASDCLSSSSSSAYSQDNYVPHVPIIPSSQPDSSTLCTFSEQNIIHGPRRLPVPGTRARDTEENNNNSSSSSNATTDPHHQLIDRLRDAGLSKDQISAHLLQLNGSMDEQEPQPQQDQQLA